MFVSRGGEAGISGPFVHPIEMPGIFDEVFAATPSAVAKRGDAIWHVSAGIIPVGAVDKRLSNRLYGPADIAAGRRVDGAVDMRMVLANNLLGIEIEFQYDGLGGVYGEGRRPGVAPGHYTVAAACLRAACFDPAASLAASHLVESGRLFT